RSTLEANDARAGGRIEIPLVGNGSGDPSFGAISTLRDDVIPATVGRLDGVEAGVTGDAASSKDFDAAIRGKAPLVFGFVLAFAFLLLLVSFRSVVIAVKAVVLNLLSVA